jgi:hypothetical protein
MEKQEINKRVDAQIPINDLGLKWLKAGKKEGYAKGPDNERAYEKIINNRRQLKRIRYANNINPAAAIYGESQVGKSYLVDSILTSERCGSLKVYDGDGKPFDFINQLNPIGGGGESTSIVSRFTTKKVWKESRYPVRVIMLSPIDIVLTLCDSYYNDVQNHIFLKEEQILQRTDELRARYHNLHDIQNNIGEDDIYDIVEYFTSGHLDRGEAFIQDLLESNYLKVLSEVIYKIPVNEWGNSFSILWNDNQTINAVFSKLISEFSRINFQSEVFISMAAVLRIEGTLLSVDRIYELFDLTEIQDGENKKRVEKAKVQDLEVSYGNNLVQRISKSAFCALAAELTFQIDQMLADEKKFLNYIDLLDFPGARSREKIDESVITKESCCAMLLRGKVAYLFNKFTSQYLISNLLFCHHERNSNVKTLSILLQKWIQGTIGKTPEDRQKFIEDSKISPLFLIGTKFNIDLQKDNIYDTAAFGEEQQQVINNKWGLRFKDTLTSVIRESPLNWFSQWVQSGSKTKSFKNLYLLRSYEFSQRFGGIFKGYLKKVKEINTNEYGEQEEIVKLLPNLNEDGSLVGETGYGEGYESFLAKLKKSFINHSFVKEHFENPSKSWDEAATPKKDGSEWIIENLTIAAENTYRSRQNKFERQILELFNELNNILRSFYHSDKADEYIRNAVKKAGRIQLELDVAFGRDPYFFGKMMQKFLLKESFIYNYYLEKIDDIELIKEADLSEYVAIRMSNPELRHKNTPENYEFNINMLKIKYAETDTDKLIKYFENKGIDLMELFFGETNCIKSNSVVLAEGLAEKWTTETLSIDRFKDLISNGFLEIAIADLMDNMRVLFKQLGITGLIAKSIRKYVDRYDKIDEIQEMIADISAEIINQFVNNMGFNHYSSEKLAEIKDTDRQNNLGLNFDHNQACFKYMETEDLKSLFDTLDNLTDILNQRPSDPENKKKWHETVKNVPNYSQYVTWKDLMQIAFVAVCNIPTYNITANNTLGEIIEKQEKAIAI